MFRHPNKRSGKAMVLQSPQGCGKSSIGVYLCDWIFGSYNCRSNIKGLCKLTQDNNINYMGKKLLVVNEASGTKDSYHSMFQDLKAMITESKEEYKMLYMDRFESMNTNEYIITTNNYFTIQVDEGDRRYFMLQCNPLSADVLTGVNEKPIENPFWKKFFGVIKNPDYDNKLYSYIYNLWEDDSFMSLSPPVTSYKRSCMNLTKNNVTSFIEALADDASELIVPMETDGVYSYPNMWSAYCSYCISIHKDAYSDKRFKELMQIVYDYERFDKYESVNGTMKRKRFYGFKKRIAKVDATRVVEMNELINSTISNDLNKIIESAEGDACDDDGLDIISKVSNVSLNVTDDTDASNGLCPFANIDDDDLLAAYDDICDTGVNDSVKGNVNDSVKGIVNDQAKDNVGDPVIDDVDDEFDYDEYEMMEEEQMQMECDAFY